MRVQIPLGIPEVKMIDRVELPVNYVKLTQPERAVIRKRYIIEQDGRCWFCDEYLCDPAAEKVLAKKLNIRLFPPGFLDHPVHLHHDHNTDLTLGAVHAYCNGYLWQYLGE